MVPSIGMILMCALLRVCFFSYPDDAFLLQPVWLPQARSQGANVMRNTTITPTLGVGKIDPVERIRILAKRTQ